MCDKLWDQKTAPTIESIESAWQETREENKGKIIADLESLNTNRLKVLSTIAKLWCIKEPNSKYFLDKVKLPLSSTQHTIKYLLDYDFVYQTNNGFELIDPVMKAFMQEK